MTRSSNAHRNTLRRNLHVLKDTAEDALESRKSELNGDAKAGRWFLYIVPKPGKVPVAEFGQTDIRDPLAPIWHSKAETAKKALPARRSA